MNTRSILILTALFFAAGCGVPEPEFYWFHPDRTIDEAKVDYEECEQKAEEEAAGVVEDRYFDRLRSPAALGSDEEPKRSKKAEDPALQARSDWGELYKKNAFSGCMQSRGYMKLRLHQIPPNLKTKDLAMGGIAGKRPER